MKKLNDAETAAFCGQLALILEAGLSSAEGISVMLEDTPEGAEHAVLEQIHDNILMTNSLAAAAEASGIFPAYAVRMMGIGEETGTLDTVCAALRDHYEREDAIRQSVKGAVLYPLIMTGMMIAVILVLITKVLPVFNRVFLQLGTEMTGLSGALLNLGNTLNRYMLVFAVVLVLIAAAAVLAVCTAKGRAAASNLAGKLPVGRAVKEKTAASRFAGALGLALSSGLSPDRGAELAAELTADTALKERLSKCVTSLNNGENLAAALRSTGLFSGLYARMTTVGERTGTMDKVLLQISERYLDEADRRIGGFLAVIEPTLVILLSLITGIILFSVMLPLTGILAGM